MTPYIRLHPRDGVKVYRTGPCTGSLLHCHIGLPGLELYTHTASGKGRYNQHSTLQYILYICLFMCVRILVQDPMPHFEAYHFMTSSSFTWLLGAMGTTS